MDVTGVGWAVLAQPAPAAGQSLDTTVLLSKGLPKSPGTEQQLPINNVVMVSGGQPRDSATHTHVSISPKLLISLFGLGGRLSSDGRGKPDSSQEVPSIITAGGTGSLTAARALQGPARQKSK